MTGTQYYDIYKRAITEFKDPSLKKMFSENQIMFFEVMYNFLENAIPLFTNPAKTRKKLKNRTEPDTFQNQFSGNGQDQQFTVTNFPDQSLNDNVVYSCLIDGASSEYQYDEDQHLLSFTTPPQAGQDIQFDIYVIGQFNEELIDDEEYILQQFIVACWQEYVNNDKLDIIRLLGDTDFKLTSNANTTTQKVGWNIVNKETVIKRMNKFAWDVQWGK